MGYFQTEMFDDLFRAVCAVVELELGYGALRTHLVFNRQYVIAAFDGNGPCIAVQTGVDGVVKRIGRIVDAGFVVARGHGNIQVIQCQAAGKFYGVADGGGIEFFVDIETEVENGVVSVSFAEDIGIAPVSAFQIIVARAAVEVIGSDPRIQFVIAVSAVQFVV